MWEGFNVYRCGEWSLNWNHCWFPVRSHFETVIIVVEMRTELPVAHQSCWIFQRAVSCHFRSIPGSNSIKFPFTSCLPVARVEKRRKILDWNKIQRNIVLLVADGNKAILPTLFPGRQRAPWSFLTASFSLGQINCTFCTFLWNKDFHLHHKVGYTAQILNFL